MAGGIPYDNARQRYRPGVAPTLRNDPGSVDELLKGYHPDHGVNARVALSVGVNRGEPCQPDLARYLQANALIDDVDIAGAQLVSTDVLIIGGGGAGCAAALTAARIRCAPAIFAAIPSSLHRW
jgi:succinate dehydrogenase / fumarate reductase flavoprotein subunit/L-aspartate oxidase